MRHTPATWHYFSDSVDTSGSISGDFVHNSNEIRRGCTTTPGQSRPEQIRANALDRDLRAAAVKTRAVMYNTARCDGMDRIGRYENPGEIGPGVRRPGAGSCEVQRTGAVEEPTSIKE